MSGIAARDNELELLEGLKDDDTVWVENLLDADSVYHSDKTKDKYAWLPAGLVGSIIPVPVKVIKESFLRRSILRGKLRLITDEQETEKSAHLVLADDETVGNASVMRALEKGASEVSHRYAKEGLSDDGTEKQSIPAAKIWSAEPKSQGMVRRSDSTIDEPVEIDAVITEPVKEGEWTPQTGPEE